MRLLSASYSIPKLCFFLLLFLSSKSFGQLISLPLTQRIDKADFIFEGKVTGKTSFWNEAHTQIYTSNIVAVYKVFKGGLTSDKVEIITYGGVVGNNMEQVSHSLQLNIGDVGVFTAIPHHIKLSQPSSLLHLKAYAGQQGFIRYNLIDHTADDPFTHYKSISDEVYPTITGRTKTSIMTVKKADFEIK
jgi:hypothetical protein